MNNQSNMAYRSKAKELRDKFEKDLKELQDNCPHKDSTWMPYMWAPGHFGPKVRSCNECDKILEQEKWEPVVNAKGNIVTFDQQVIQEQLDEED